jgi:hypothetical protein
MTSTTERRLGYAIAIICLIIGGLSYGMLPAKAPANPVRVMFTAMGGNVLFDHQAHIDNYGLECNACHHSVNASDTDAPGPCGGCHQEDSVYTSAFGENGLFDHPAHSDEFGLVCTDCHHTYTEDDPGGPEMCSDCHNREAEDEYMLGRADAFHTQCIGCHEDFGVIPGQSDCDGCHMPRPRKDAFHAQCMKCHQESGAGPAGSDCKICHGY